MSKYQEVYKQLWVEINTHHITPDNNRVMQQSPHNHLLEVLKELVDKAHKCEILDDLYKDMFEAVKEGYKRGLNSDTETFEGGKFQAYRYVFDFIVVRFLEDDLVRRD